VIYVFYTIHVLVCLFLILVVLLQQGKGADLSVFGGGSTQAAFGARGAATLLHKMTVGGFIAFIVTTVTIGFLQGGGSRGSVVSTVVEETAPEARPVETPSQAQPEETRPDAPAAAPSVEEPAAADAESGSGPQTEAGEAESPPDPASDGTADQDG
jgi:preprotein translocase subunit SecG